MFASVQTSHCTIAHNVDQKGEEERCREMKRTGGLQALWRFRGFAFLLSFTAVGVLHYSSYRQNVPGPPSIIFRPQLGGEGPAFVLFAEAGGVIKTFKRMVNQGWRVGARELCNILGCDYEYVKAQLYAIPSAFVSFKALCIQMDRLEMDISSQMGGEATPTQKELRYILLTKAAKLMQQHLDLQVEIPAKYLPPSVESNVTAQRPSTGQRPGAQQGSGQTIGGETGAAEAGSSPRARTDEEMRQRLNALHDAVQLPTAEEFDRSARQRLTELQKQHAMQTVKLKDMSRQKLQMLTETHEQESARLFNELQQTQTAELSVVRGELEKQRRVFVQALEAFSVTGKLLAQSKTYMQRLYAAVQQMAAHFSRLVTVETKLANLLKALQQETPATFQYSCLHAASQSDAAVTQVMKQVLAVYEESTSIADQVQKILNDAETTVETPAIEAAQLGSQKQMFKDRLNQFRAASYNLIARMEETVQSAEERKLVTLFISEDVRNKVLGAIRDRVGQWKDELTRLQERTEHVDSSHAQFLQMGAALGRRVLAAVNGVLQSPAGDALAGVSEEIAEVEKQGNKIREELSLIIEALPVLEQDIRSMAESLRAANIPITTLEELGVPSLLAALQSEHELKEKAQKMFVAVRAGLGRTENTLRIIQALQKETHLLRSPTDREALDSEIRDIMSKLRDISHSKAEVEVDLKHLHVDIQQLQNSIHQINQRLNLERKSAHLAGDIRGWMGKGDERDAGDEKAAAALSALEEELRAATESLATKQQELAIKHSQKMELLGEAKKLEAEMQSRQRIVAEEQTRIARMTQLSQAVMDGLHSDEATRRTSQRTATL